jgi:hypothetical protein
MGTAFRKTLFTSLNLISRLINTSTIKTYKTAIAAISTREKILEKYPASKNTGSSISKADSFKADNALRPSNFSSGIFTLIDTIIPKIITVSTKTIPGNMPARKR